jgi:hypothetical protein
VNAELGVTDWLRQHVAAGIRVTTDTPADLVGNVPLVAVDWLGGGQDVNLGRPMFRVSSFDVTKFGASSLADAVHDLVAFRLRGAVTGGYITTTKTILSPAQNKGYANPNVAVYVAQYQAFVLDPVNHF